MRREWRGLARGEQALVCATCAAGAAAFAVLAGERAGPAAWVALYVALLPLLATGLVTTYSGLDLRRRVVARRTQRAITRGELAVHYQPLVRLRDRQVPLVEALVRWRHPNGHLVPPGVFLPAISNTPRGRQLDLHVLDIALAQAAAWASEGRPLAVAVNVCPAGLLDPHMPDEVSAALARHNVAPGRLELEVTEVAFDDGPAFQRALERVKEIGVGIALDDFGVGYSSLARLVRLPVDRLKIDRLFVTRMLFDRRAACVVRASIDVAHDLEVEVVGEGVETAEVLERLKELECDLAQGYLFSPPVPPEGLTERVERSRELRIRAHR